MRNRDERDAERADLTELHGDTVLQAAPEVGHCATHGDYTPWRSADYQCPICYSEQLDAWQDYQMSTRPTRKYR